MKRNTTIPQSASLTAPFTQRGLIIGITGGTGWGKTTLLSVIKEHGGLVIDCDQLYHQLLLTNKSLLDKIEARFPGVVQDGILQRKKLGSLVFTDKKALQDLNAITHKAVYDAVLKLLSSAPKLTAIDAIGLFESGLNKLCDITIAVTAPVDARIARLVERDQIPEEYAKSRIAAQPANETFSALCDYTLENNETTEAFREKCLVFLKTLDIIIL